MNNKKKCFVIMPFSDTQSCTEQKWTEIFEYIIKPAVEESQLGYECIRSVAKRENIIKGILEALNKANVVIADLTDRNPNVFYELGVRHTLANRTILITQGQEHIPSDLTSYPFAFYSESPAKIAEFKNAIKEKLEDIETNPERSDSPVADFLKNRNVVLLSAEKSANLKKLSGLISELSHNIGDADFLLKQIKNPKQQRKKGKGATVATPLRYNSASLELLLTTQYITLRQELLESVGRVRDVISIINNILEWCQEPGFAEEAVERLEEALPRFRTTLISLLQDVSKVNTDYANDNYVEPKVPTILLSEPEHKKYLESGRELKI